MFTWRGLSILKMYLWILYPPKIIGLLTTANPQLSNLEDVFMMAEFSAGGVFIFELDF